MIVPDGKVAEIWSHGYCEDGLTFMLYVVLEDGSDAFISICPGQQIRVLAERACASQPPSVRLHVVA